MCPSISNKTEYQFCLKSASKFFTNFVEQKVFRENQLPVNHFLFKSANKFLAVHVLTDLNITRPAVENLHQIPTKSFKIDEHFTMTNILEA
jgi:hypothetical protein